MSEKYKIVPLDEPAWQTIGQGINHFNKSQGGEDNAQSLCFVLQGSDEEVVGGVIGSTYWGWLHIDLMWIKEDLRGQGYGQQLLMQSEEEARQRGAKQVYLDTFSFQAPEFYKKYGYKVFGELANFPEGHQRYFLTKQL